MWLHFSINYVYMTSTGKLGKIKLAEDEHVIGRNM
jgi:hypothetical protein